MIMAATFAVDVAGNSEPHEENSLCRASELPIYTQDEVLERGEKVEEHVDTEEAVLQYMENVVLRSQQKYEEMCAHLNDLKQDGMNAYLYTKGNVESMYR